MRARSSGDVPVEGAVVGLHQRLELAEERAEVGHARAAAAAEAAEVEAAEVDAAAGEELLERRALERVGRRVGRRSRRGGCHSCLNGTPSAIGSARDRDVGAAPAPSTVRLVEIRETPLDVAEVLASLDEDADGGVTLFVGRSATTTAAGRSSGLDYSAHPTALDRLREVCEQVAARHDVHGVAAVHRVGQPRASATSRWSSRTAAAHRGMAFDASRDLIDTLKDEVPIWKHQVFADGSDEWVGTP